jgi:hypothetical protein
MNTSSLFTVIRLLYPALFFLIGYAVGNRIPSMESEPATNHPLLLDRQSIKNRVPATFESSRVASHSRGIDEKLRFDEASNTVWLPLSVAEQFTWRWGDIGKNAYLTNQSRSILKLTAQTSKAVENSIDSAVLAIRYLERKNVQILEQTDLSVKMRIPSGIDVTAPMHRMETEIESLLGKTISRLILPKVIERLRKISSAVRDEEWYISVRLVDSGIDVQESNRINSASSRGNTIPDSIQHLVQVPEAIIVLPPGEGHRAP